MKDIIVLGFGRSGTTWISDIISKVKGSVILFEPLHPSVTEYSEEFSYSCVTERQCSARLKAYLREVLAKRHRKMWLMRNHVPTRLEELSQDFLEQLWRECSIIGFKEIRANFMIDWFHKNLNGKIVYIIRHPCAVLASIKKRTNFWEFGWPKTYELFLEKTIFNDTYRNHDIAGLAGVVEDARSDLDKYAVMWSVTHAIALPELKRHKIPLFYYENFYSEPFLWVRKMFEYLNDKAVNIHPAYIFTPSMTTLKTLHGLRNVTDPINGNSTAFFWDKVLSKKEVDRVMEIVRSFGIDNYDKKGAVAVQYDAGESTWRAIEKMVRSKYAEVFWKSSSTQPS